MVAPTFTLNYPKTADEWWANVALVREVLPEWGPKDDLLGTCIGRAPESYAIRVLGQKLYTYYKDNALLSFYEALDKLIAERNGPLVLAILNSIWSDAPDASYIHSWPRWGTLCDLCSEGPACLGLEPEEEDV